MSDTKHLDPVVVEQLRRLSPEDLETHAQLVDQAGVDLGWASRWDDFAQRAISRSKEARERAEKCLIAAYRIRSKGMSDEDDNV